MVAGEASGDLLAASLISGIVNRWPGAKLAGIGGPKMIAKGFDAWWPSEKLAVRGYVEVLRHYREIVGIRSQLKARLMAQKPDIFLGVDAPDFNLDLEEALQASGVKTVHFICPSIWAWRPDRVEKIRKSARHVLCIFPFEVDLLREHGIDATYVGHPLAHLIPEQADRVGARALLGLGASEPVVAILPGSRQSEIKYLAGRFFEAAALVKKAKRDTQFIVPVMASLRAQVTEAAQNAGMLPHLKLLDGQSHAALAACDVTLVASGTATLEAALFKRPMVIAYNMNWLSWQIMRRKKLQPWVSLPNILCRDFVVPEFIQEAATPQALAGALLDWIANPGKVESLQRRFGELHTQLTRDTAKLSTDAIQQVLQG